MTPFLIASIVAISLFFAGGVGLAFALLFLARPRDNGWERLATKLADTMIERDERLLLRTGHPAAPVVNQATPEPPKQRGPMSEDEWIAQDEAAEIEEKARRCNLDEDYRKDAEDAAHFDPSWQAVVDRAKALREVH